jgi:hypothetical protein
MPSFVDAHRLEAHVRMLSESLAPRDAAHPTQLERVAAYVQEEFVRAQAAVVDQPFHVDGIPYRNIIARYGPETPECVVVGAHYDAAGPYPGADDNASGVAGLLALAVALGKPPLPRRVERFSLENSASLGCAPRHGNGSLTIQPIFMLRCEPRFMTHCRKVSEPYPMLKRVGKKNTTQFG